MAVPEKEKEYIESLKENQESNIDSEAVTQKLLKSEREIILIFNEEEGVWVAETSIPKYWRRLEAKNWKCVKTQYYSDGTVCSKSFVGGKKGVTIGDPFKKREMSEEQREAARQRFLKTKNSEQDNDEAE